MNNYEFKSGDKVYYPKIGTAVYTLTDLPKGGRCSVYPLGLQGSVSGGNVGGTFTTSGKFRHNENVQEIFLATPENKACLDKLYGLDFEVYVDKNSSGYTEKLLKESGKPVLCFCGDSGDDELIKNLGEVHLVSSFSEKALSFKTFNGDNFLYAIPIFDKLNFTTGANEDE